MKMYILILAFLVPMFSFGQFKPIAGIEMFSHNEIVMRTYGQELKYDIGDLSVIYGLEYQLDGLRLKTSANTSMYFTKLTSYKPTTSEFKISASYTVKSISVKVEHMCSHPLQSYHDVRIKVFSGYTKLGVYWNMTPYCFTGK